MNKIRRKEIMAAIKGLSVVSGKIENDGLEQHINELQDIISDIQMILEEETDYMENIPENLQGGERYGRAEEACESLEEAVDILDYISIDDSIESIVDDIDKATDCLSDAM